MNITEQLSKDAQNYYSEYYKLARGLASRITTDVYRINNDFKPFGPKNARIAGIPMIFGIIPPPYFARYVATKSTPQSQIRDEDLAKSTNNDRNVAVKKANVQAVEDLSDEFLNQTLLSADELKTPPEELAALILASSGADPKAFGLFGSLRQGIVQLDEEQIRSTGASQDIANTFSYQDSVDQLKVATSYLKKQNEDGYDNAGQMLMVTGGFAPDQAKNPNAVLAEDTAPGNRVYDKNYTARPDGLRPKVKGEKGYDPNVSQAQRKFDGVLDADLRSKPAIKTSDVTAKVDSIKRTRAYQVFKERLDRRRLERLDGSTDIATGRLKSEAFEAGSLWGVDPTAALQDPTSSTTNKTTAIDASRQLSAVAKQTADINRQLQVIRNIPPLALLVNPKSFSKNYEHTYDYAKGRRKDIVSLWLEKPTTLSASGTTVAAYSITELKQGGITGTQRVNSLMYENLMSLVGIYRNNGMLFQGGFDGQNRGVPTLPLSVFIYYDGRVYIGSFDQFSISDRAEAPFTYEFSFDFTVRFEIQAYDQ